jgi:hypothetical protein
VAQLDQRGMMALGRWMGRGGRRSGRGAARYTGGANGGGGWTGRSPEWAGDGAFFLMTTTSDDLGASVVDPSRELHGARPNKLVMRAAPPGVATQSLGAMVACGVGDDARHSTKQRSVAARRLSRARDGECEEEKGFLASASSR